MAARLKNKNFESIKIFEATNRVGGKSYDMFFDGKIGPLGTIFLMESVIPFVKQYDAADLVSIQHPAVSIIIIINRHIQKNVNDYLRYIIMI